MNLKCYSSYYYYDYILKPRTQYMSNNIIDGAMCYLGEIKGEITTNIKQERWIQIVHLLSTFNNTIH